MLAGLMLTSIFLIPADGHVGSVGGGSFIKVPGLPPPLRKKSVLTGKPLSSRPSGIPASWPFPQRSPSSPPRCGAWWHKTIFLKGSFCRGRESLSFTLVESSLPVRDTARRIFHTAAEPARGSVPFPRPRAEFPGSPRPVPSCGRRPPAGSRVPAHTGGGLPGTLPEDTAVFIRQLCPGLAAGQLNFRHTAVLVHQIIPGHLVVFHGQVGRPLFWPHQFYPFQRRHRRHCRPVSRGHRPAA